MVKSKFNNWHKVELGEIVTLKGGKRLPKGHELTTEVTCHPYIRARDIRNATITFNNPVYITDETFRRISRYTVNANDICITIVGANVGDIGVVPQFLHGANLTENSVKLVDLRYDCNSTFLKYFLLGPEPQSQMKLIAAGAAQPKLGLYKLQSIVIKLPPLDTQRKIAGVLSAHDDLIENNTRRIKILEEMAQTIYREWFVNFRYPGHEKVKMVESELGMNPEGWEVKRVENLVKRVKPGKLYAQKTAKSIGKILILDQGRSGIIGYHNDEPGVVASPDNPIIVFANHTCYQRLILHPFSAIQNVLPFLPADGNYRSIYWLHWSTKDIIEFNDYKGHWPEFMNKRILLPPPTICDEFSTIVQPIVRIIYNFEQKNQNLRQTRDLLLPKLISGELDVSELDIEIEAK